MSRGPSDPVESLVILLGQLELTISVRHRDRSNRDPLPSLSLGTPSGYPASSVRSVASWEPVSTAPGLPEALINQAVRATNPTAFAALDLSHLGLAQHRLTGQDRLWSPAARLGRAFKAGVIARFRLNGDIRNEASPSVPFRNSYYVVLRNGPGFWTTSYRSYIAQVSDPRGLREPESSTISHGFASQAERAAYISGAQVEWPE